MGRAGSPENTCRERVLSASPTDTPPAERPLDGRTDGSLIRRYRGGQDDAATSIYLRYAHRLRALARQHCTGAVAGRVDADDVVQSVFRTFFQGVRRDAYDAPAEGEIWGLLMVLALNKIRSLVVYHKAQKRDARQLVAAPDLDRRAVLARDETAAVFLRMVLDEQLAGLPESNQAVVRLRIEGHDLNDIAARTGRSRRTVERVLHDFRALLSRPE